MAKKICVTLLITLFAVGVGLYMDYSEKNDINTQANAVGTEYENIDNTGSGWGLKKVKGDEPEVLQKQKDVLKKYDALYMDMNKPKKLYLTFDEGYENGYTAQILDILKEKSVPAAFFITGPYADKERELVRRMIDDGHIVGNHTVNHPNLPKLQTAEKISEELAAMNKKVSDIYSYDMKYMRPPEGEYSERVLAVARDMGFRTVFWSFAYRDWEVDKQRGSAYAFSRVSEYIHDGAILLLHAVSKDNTEALPDIIDYARAIGYEFSSLDEI